MVCRSFRRGSGNASAARIFPSVRQGPPRLRKWPAHCRQVSAVFSSPLTRAVETARAVCSEYTVLDGLRELDYGQWEGLSFPEIRQNYPELYAARGGDPRLQPPGAESNEAGLSRFSAAMEDAARRSPGDLAVVAHGGIIALFLERVTGRWYKPRYCEVISLVWDDSGFYQREETP